MPLGICDAVHGSKAHGKCGRVGTKNVANHVTVITSDFWNYVSRRGREGGREGGRGGK